MAPSSAIRRGPAWIHALVAALIYALFAAMPFIAHWATIRVSATSVAYFGFVCIALPAAILMLWRWNRTRRVTATRGILIGLAAAVLAGSAIPVPFLAHLVARADSIETLMFGAFDLLYYLVGHGALLAAIAVPIGAIVGMVARWRQPRGSAQSSLSPHTS